MSKKERVKFTLDFAKALVFALLTALFGIFAFVVIHIDTINTFQKIASLVGVVLIVIFFYFLIKYISKKLDELERLD
ncbi:hypothetical protein CHLV4142_10370 [Campylobacter helveticus]|uniref:Uncharacterized protein n=1 Tax=Campylobacter helveticus TaxID=28898 RepID=A0ABY3L028_9BACT|nr:hypothetical protein [Campylobacter helveticus]EDP7907515.1 hypothetical protein [Campylobacter upsaliensis]MCR2040544.1 hypothetical protein [Campylobacter helveticus]TXK56177.1 hypothetical protein FVD16_08345 [Campylobacter helveticus]HEF3559983.1 hypothetical protein [Campylobacter upsaliensis]